MSINRAASRMRWVSMGMDARGQNSAWLCGKADDCGLQSCGCVLSVCLLPEVMLLLLSSSVAEVGWLRNDLLLGRSRLTEMMMEWERWVVGRRADWTEVCLCAVQAERTDLVFEVAGSREWEWSLPGAGEVQVQLQLQSCRTLARCQVWEGACCGRSVSVSVRRTWTWTPAPAAPCNATDRDLGELAASPPTQEPAALSVLWCSEQTACIYGTRPVCTLHSEVQV